MSGVCAAIAGIATVAITATTTGLAADKAHKASLAATQAGQADAATRANQENEAMAVAMMQGNQTSQQASDMLYAEILKAMGGSISNSGGQGSCSSGSMGTP